MFWTRLFDLLHFAYSRLFYREVQFCWWKVVGKGESSNFARNIVWKSASLDLTIYHTLPRSRREDMDGER